MDRSIAAFVDREWWFDDRDNRDAPHPVLDRMPPQWLPHGRGLPTTWQAHLFNGTHAAVRIRGPLHLNIIENAVISSDLVLTPQGDGEGDYGSRSVAIAGGVDVRLFTDFRSRSVPSVNAF